MGKLLAGVAMMALLAPKVDEFGEYRSASVCFANFEVPLLQGTCGAAYKSAGDLWSVGSRRIQVYEIEVGQTGTLNTSTDCQVEWDVSRFGTTAAIVGTAVVPNLLDPADGASVSIFQNAITTELTYTTAGLGLNLKHWPINQRGFSRWRALDDGDNLVVPATSLFGLGARALSSGFTGSLTGNLSFIDR